MAESAAMAGSGLQESLSTRPRRDTLSSHAISEGDSERVDTCRICRGEATPGEPLFYPCKCSGSIKFVHQECLMEWLGHSHKKHCELCKTPFRFTKLYDANMPPKLPWLVFAKRASMHLTLGLARAFRTALVVFVWLGAIPWLIRWIWRWLLWVADAAWAREAFMDLMRNGSVAIAAQQDDPATNVEWIALKFRRFFDADAIFNETGEPLAHSIANAVAKNLGFGSAENTTVPPPSFAWPQADPSILSAWTYLAELTTSPRVNRLILDVFEGQLITCVVITGFILVFLIREWVVQQHPLVNLDILNAAHQEAERLRAEHERLERQEELLTEARRRLVELQDQTHDFGEAANSSEFPAQSRKEFMGWDNLGMAIDFATENLRKGGDTEHATFVLFLKIISEQIRAAVNSNGVRMDQVAEKIHEKLAAYDSEMREVWNAIIVFEVEDKISSYAAQDTLLDTDTGQDEQKYGEGRFHPETSSSQGILTTLHDQQSFGTTQVRQALGHDDFIDQSAGNVSPRRQSKSFNSPGKTVCVINGPTLRIWRHISPVGNSRSQALDFRPTPGIDPEVESSSIDEPLPITNAGPDAKMNIKRSGTGKRKAVPEPEIEFDDLLKKFTIESEEEGLALRQITDSYDNPNYTHTQRGREKQPDTGPSNAVFYSDISEEQHVASKASLTQAQMENNPDQIALSGSFSIHTRTDQSEAKKQPDYSLKDEYFELQGERLRKKLPKNVGRSNNFTDLPHSEYIYDSVADQNKRSQNPLNGKLPVGFGGEQSKTKEGPENYLKDEFFELDGERLRKKVPGKGTRSKQPGILPSSAPILDSAGDQSRKWNRSVSNSTEQQAERKSQSTFDLARDQTEGESQSLFGFRRQQLEDRRLSQDDLSGELLVDSSDEKAAENGSLPRTQMRSEEEMQPRMPQRERVSKPSEGKKYTNSSAHHTEPRPDESDLFMDTSDSWAFSEQVGQEHAEQSRNAVFSHGYASAFDREVRVGALDAVNEAKEAMELIGGDIDPPRSLANAQRAPHEVETVLGGSQTGLNDGQAALNSAQQAAEPPRHNDAERSYLQQIIDWFWGDIQPQGALEPTPMPDEERQEADDRDDWHEVPFVPIQDGQPVIGIPPLVAAEEDNEQAEEDDDGDNENHNDANVVAAAAQAGIDVEALEDAEDLEGILELIGLQGPLIGLFQTSAFCTLLVASTIVGAVLLPYIWGKLVLSFIASPLYFLVKAPLQIASFTADLLIDTSLLLGGWVFIGLALAVDFALSACQAWSILSSSSATKIEKCVDLLFDATANSGARLQALFVSIDPEQGLRWSWAFLVASVHAHASLRTIEGEVNAIFSFLGQCITLAVDAISSGRVWQWSRASLAGIPQVSILVSVITTALGQYTQPILNFFADLKRGSLTFEMPEVSMDPSLVYWNSTDRSMAILAGYIALAALAAVYVAADTPITRSESGRRTEKMIRDTLRQAGGVLKVILIISIEMLVFPLYCGLLLDIAFLPLFQDASVATRWAFAGSKPTTFCFVHWFVGTCYMFHFALFVGMCRKILRKGVLWFIRDPDDPTFHPVRDVLERNVITQLRKIAFSALVYGALVILCLGGVIWTIGKVFDGIFPIHWFSIEPVLEFPLDLLLYNFITPLIIKFFKPSEVVSGMYAWWLRKCARVLRLSHFLFDDRRRDEEGRHVHKSWLGFLLMKKAKVGVSAKSERHELAESDEAPDVSFRHDGKYVLTPCNDQYRPPKPGEAFLHTDKDDVYVADKDGNKNTNFSKVYVPPFFRLRVTLFMVCLWLFSAFTGLCATLVPLIFGRHLIASIVPQGIYVNDIYAYTLGTYVLGGVFFIAFKGRSGIMYLHEKAAGVDHRAWIAPAKHFVLKSLKCAYFYGFVGIALAMIFASFLQFYIILPLSTSLQPSMLVGSSMGQNANGTALLNATEQGSHFTQNVSTGQLSARQRVAQHTIHILQDYALGLLYVRLASSFLIAAPQSRAAEAFRRIVSDGYLNPDIKLATRFFILPVSLLATLMLVVPPLVAKAAIITANSVTSSSALLDADIQTKIYRYSYPMAAVCVFILCSATELGKATSRWRARIRDEVYLVGERLHNFGERKPPEGSRSVVRKDL